MIIYYHCNSDNALLLSFLLTCHPYIPAVHTCLATLSVLGVRISLLEYSKIHEKAYKCIVCEFGGFQNVLRDACVCAIPT